MQPGAKKSRAPERASREAPGSVPVLDLKPGEQFTAASGTSWSLEFHGSGVSWARRVSVPGEREPDAHWQGGPVAVGELDRFFPGVMVQRWQS